MGDDGPLYDMIADRLASHEAHMNTTVDRLKDQLLEMNTALAKHIATEEEDRKVLEQLGKTVWGNGVPGHNIRIDRLEQSRNMLVYFLTGIMVPVGLFAIYAVIHWAFHLL